LINDLLLLKFLLRGKDLNDGAQVWLDVLAELAHKFKHFDGVLPTLNFQEKAQIGDQKAWRSRET